jgi:hypothetical protein
VLTTGRAGYRRRQTELGAKLAEIHKNKPRAGSDEALTIDITRLESSLKLAQEDLVRPIPLLLAINSS